MEIHIDRNSGIPIYIQLRKQIKMMIEKGILSKGDRLPSERELAEKLKISRNRVSTAYKELEAENILSSQQGKGTFIAGGITGVYKTSRKDKLLKIIDLAMEEAIILGFSLKDFLTIAYIRTKEKEEISSKIKVAFIECNKEQLAVLLKEVELTQNVVIIPILIKDLRDDPLRIRKALSKVEIIVTTSFHLNEVEDFITGMKKEIIEMILEPSMSTIIELARIESKKRIGLICKSVNFAREVENSLLKIGLNNLDYQYTTKESKELDEFLTSHEILITSPQRFKEVKRLVGENKQVISFNYLPDHGSVNMLKMALFDLKGN